MRFILILIVTVTISSCYKRVEGCLDPLSSNFNPNADDACGSCCTNPLLKMTLKHQLADTFYNPADSVQNDLGQWYKLLSFNYYLADFMVSDQGGREISGERTIDYIFQNSKKSTKDNFVLVRPTTFDYTINEIRQYGQFDSLVFTVGLPDSIRRADNLDVLDTHVLSDSLFVRDENNTKSWCTFTIAKGDNFSDTLQLSFALSDPEIPVRLAVPVSNTIGKDLALTIIADYAAWFKTADVNLPPEQLKAAIRGNLRAAFRVE